MRKKILSLFAVSLAATMACGLIAVTSMNKTGAYMTAKADRMVNTATIALDSESKIIEDFDPPTPKNDPTITYKKAVKIENSGQVGEYVRVKLSFSDRTVESKTSFSSNGSTFYSVADYKNHLPSGWVYNDKDGFYYYNKVLESGKSTPNLMSHVRTNFGTMAEMVSYDLTVFNESVPSFAGTNYTQAWENYLKSN